MRVIGPSPDPLARMHTMTGKQVKSGKIDVKALLAGDEEFLRALVRTALEEVLEAEMTEALGAEKSERTANRLAHTAARTRNRPDGHPSPKSQGRYAGGPFRRTIKTG